MLLIEKTIAEFGHDPRSLKPKSNARVYYQCAECKAEKETAYIYYKEGHTCKSCLNTQRSLKVAQEHRENMMSTASERYFSPQILIEETLERFGYHPHELAVTSSKRVVYNCAACHEPKDTALKNLTENHRCKQCADKAKLTKNAEEMLAKNLSPSGNKRGGLDKERDKQNHKIAAEKRLLAKQSDIHTV